MLRTIQAAIAAHLVTAVLTLLCLGAIGSIAAGAYAVGELAATVDAIEQRSAQAP